MLVSWRLGCISLSGVCALVLMGSGGWMLGYVFLWIRENILFICLKKGRTVGPI